MSQPWIKVWQEKILSSMNLRRCNYSAHSLFLEYLIRVRPDGEYAGKLCYPNGLPILDKELWADMKMKARDYRTAKDRLIELNIILVDKKGCIYLRKFNELQASIKDTKTGQYRDNVGTKSSINSLSDKELQSLQNRTEQNRIDKDTIDAKASTPIDVTDVIKTVLIPKDIKPNKPESDYNARDLLWYFGNKYQEIVTYPYPATFGKEGKIFKDLLSLYKSTQLLDLIDMFFWDAESDTAWTKDKLTIGVFKTQVPKLLIQLRERVAKREKEINDAK